MTKVEGRVRESADGLRRRPNAELEKARLREAQQEVAEAAAARRAADKEKDSD